MSMPPRTNTPSTSLRPRQLRSKAMAHPVPPKAPVSRADHARHVEGKRALLTLFARAGGDRLHVTAAERAFFAETLAEEDALDEDFVARLDYIVPHGTVTRAPSPRPHGLPIGDRVWARKYP